MASQKLSDVRAALSKPATERNAEERALVAGAEPKIHDAAELIRTEMARIKEMGSPPLRIRMPRFDNLVDLELHAARERKESQEREIAMLETLQNISGQLGGLNDRISKQDEQIRRHDEELVRLRSGAPGRPSAMHLVVAEFERRVQTRELESTLAEQSRVLAVWLQEKHSGAAHTTAKTIENKIRGAYRRARRPAVDVAEKPRDKKQKTSRGRAPKII